MNVYNLLKQREASDRPIKIGIIGAGIYGSMFLSQLRFIPGMQLVGIAELDVAKAKDKCIRAGWSETAISIGKSTDDINEGSRNKKIVLINDSEKLIQADLDIIVEITGITEVGAYNAWYALEAGKHVITVTVEADALLGKSLKQLADSKGLVYSLGYGDEPAVLCEQIEWARTAGFEVICGGKCVPYSPEKHYSTPETVRKEYGLLQGLTEEQIAADGYNMQMYNSFNDGSKEAIEMCSVANACDLIPQASGLKHPPIEYDDFPSVLKPKSEGGILDHSGTIEVPSQLKRDGTPLKRCLHFGTYLVFKGRSDFVRHHLSGFSREAHRLVTDPSCQYAMIYRPTHIIGLELGISVASVGLLGIPTGSPSSFVADVASVAKKDLKPGDFLDGEGGYAAFGRLVSAEQSLKGGYLPMGLSNNAKVIRAVAKDSIITYDDVVLDENSFLYQLRKKIEKEDQFASH